MENNENDNLIIQPNKRKLAAMKNRDTYQPTLYLIQGAFSRPSTAYFARAEAIKVVISLKKLLTTNTLEDATEATKDCLDAKSIVDSEILDEIVCKKVLAKTKKLMTELSQVKK